jgi:hypothetical protein
MKRDLAMMIMGAVTVWGFMVKEWRSQYTLYLIIAGVVCFLL